MVDVPHLISKPDKVFEETEAIAQKIAKQATPTILLLNKVDLVSDKLTLLPLIERLNAIHTFHEVIPISARKGDGKDRLLKATVALMPEGPALFPGDALTDRTMRFMTREVIREKLFMRLQKELPYQLAVSIDSWKEREDGLITIHAAIHVARSSQKAIVIGRGGSLIKAVGQASRKELEGLLSTRIYLDLHVRVEEDWIDREAGLRKLGYDEM